MFYPRPAQVAVADALPSGRGLAGRGGDGQRRAHWPARNL